MIVRAVILFVAFAATSLPVRAEIVTLVCDGGSPPLRPFTVDIDTDRGTANWVDADWRNQYGAVANAEVTDRYYTFGWPPRRGWLYRVDRRTGIYQVYAAVDGTWNTNGLKCERATEKRL